MTIARRPELPPEPRGDLLQAGPLLVRHGRPCVAGDPEGLSSGAGQFDSDITAGRHPRAALAVGRRGRLLAVAADGRADDDAGLTLDELAEALVAVGAVSALNLDGGGSTSLVGGGRLRNRPREAHGIELDGGRPVTRPRSCSPPGDNSGTTIACARSAASCSSRAGDRRTSPGRSPRPCPPTAGT